LLVAGILSATSTASADPEDADIGELGDDAVRGQMRTRAESVSFDTRERSLELDGNVRIDLPPFHLRSHHLTLARTKYGIEAKGDGHIAFCPCLGTPLTIEFDKAIVAPPGELLLRSPKLEFYGVPVMWLPWFWLRSDEKVGILPPEIAYRGQDGVYLGDGVHLPWKSGGARRTLDLRAGAYLDGGFVADARLTTPTSTTKVRYDRLVGARAPALLVPGSSADPNADDGLLIDARGATHDASSALVWDADVLRGRRGVAATSDLDAASKPWDRASAAGSVALGAVRAETGVRLVTRRGGDLRAIEAAGPFLALRSSGALGTQVTYDATVEGGAVRVSGAAAGPVESPDSLSYARAEAGLLGTTSFGPLAASVQVRGAGDVAAEGRRNGSDGAGTARVRVSLPLARDYEPDSTDDPYARNDPWQHVIEPYLEGAIVHQEGSDLLGTRPGRGLATLTGTAPITDGGLRSTLGRWGTREALEAAVAGGAAYGDDVGGARPMLRARLAATFGLLGATAESGHVFGDGAGNAVSARMRLGRADGVRLTASVAATGALDPILARALTDPALEAPAGYFARRGTTGGGGVVVPWNKLLTTSAGADFDANEPALVAARGGIEVHDRCGCVTLRVNGAHRIGRQGVDVWLAIDFAADR